ncbi:glyoxalase [Undibacterium fentianense]|uniref:Glyoxalase n=1 Tax=Undibacterium fentianense TaxID=2828728 RepID=A0A941E2Z5_9BURK|nr:glyoxalase [Undibacterium fentianense]MBR7800112.1 glyoxalase [Undibacterium fentianense]
MESRKVNNLTVFIPSKDFSISCKFYEDLGFQKTVSNGNAFRYEIDGFGFWLQDYYVKEWAENCMLCLYVENIQSWYERIKQLNLPENYAGLAKVYSEPHQEHGSLIMNLGDPSGVLWHIYQGA